MTFVVIYERLPRRSCQCEQQAPPPNFEVEGLRGSSHQSRYSKFSDMASGELSKSQVRKAGQTLKRSMRHESVTASELEVPSTSFSGIAQPTNSRSPRRTTVSGRWCGPRDVRSRSLKG